MHAEGGGVKTPPPVFFRVSDPPLNSQPWEVVLGNIGIERPGKYALGVRDRSKQRLSELGTLSGGVL